MSVHIRKSSEYDRPWSDNKDNRHKQRTVSRSSINNSYQSVSSYLEFYNNIPDYTDLHDLSDSEFYSRLNCLKETQKNFVGVSSALDESDSCVGDRPSSRSSFGSRLMSKTPEDGGRRYIRTPEDTSAVGRTLKPPPKITLSRPSGHDTQLPEEAKSPDGSSLLSQPWKKKDDTDRDESNPSQHHSHHHHHHHHHRQHYCGSLSSLTPSYSQQMCRSMGALSLSSSGLHIHGESMVPKPKKAGKKRKTHEVPLLSRIPLFDKIMAEQELRRRITHERNVHELQALVQPFSFTKREEEMKTGFRTCSSPDLRPHSCQHSRAGFKAKPVPKHLFSDVAYERMREDQFYRALRKRIRAEEMLKGAALPPSMEARENMTKGRSKSLDFLNEENAPRRRSCSRNRGYRRAQNCIAREIRSSKSQNRGKSAWLGSKTIPSSTTDSSADGSPNTSTMGPPARLRRQPRPHSALSGTRSNLASVLRMQTSRNRMESEMKEQLAEQELQNKAKFKARLMRMTPAWRQLDYSTEEDLALRLAQRRAEARVRRLRHRHMMESIYGRVHEMPRLFQEPFSLREMMPSVAPATERTDAQWQALKRYIIRLRERQKQEQEADAEVQRQRREREQKQKQDVMTLEETREQICTLEIKLAALTEEKHQLFLTLKKVLNEDDNRRKQAAKDTPADMLGAGPNYPGISAPQVFSQLIQNRALPFKVSPAGTTPGPSGNKRTRSPTPPPSGGPTYHPYNNYKSGSGFQHKPDYVRAVLWNKPAATYGGVYGVTPSQPVYSYAQAGGSYDQVYLQRQAYESKAEPEKLYLRGPPGPLPMPVHPAQPQKTGGISTGFPVRTPHQPHSVYLTQGNSSNNRLLYGTAPTSVPTARYQNAGTI